MRYVTITQSQWFNNGTGIVPNALHSEKYAPPEDNVITDNDVFWNNFNYYKGAPFRVNGHDKDSTPYPVGVGILLFGSRRTQVDGQPRLRQLPRGRRDDQAVPAQPGAGRAGPRRQPGHEQRVRSRRDRPQRPRPRLRRQRHGQLLRRQHRRRGDRARRRLHVRRPARSRARTRSRRTTEQDVVTWALDSTHETYWAKSAHVAEGRASSRSRTTGPTPGRRPRSEARGDGRARRCRPRARARRHGERGHDAHRQGRRRLLRADEDHGESRHDDPLDVVRATTPTRTTSSSRRRRRASRSSTPRRRRRTTRSGAR